MFGNNIRDRSKDDGVNGKRTKRSGLQHAATDYAVYNVILMASPSTSNFTFMSLVIGVARHRQRWRALSLSLSLCLYVCGGKRGGKGDRRKDEIGDYLEMINY